MSSSDTLVGSVMTKDPQSIGPNEPLEAAREMIKKLRVRHLPVNWGGKPVGVLSDRDVALLADLCSMNFKNTNVKEVMTPDPYCVGPETHLKDVVEEMADRKIGSALVVDETGKLVGIFTYTDALRTLAKCLA